MAHGLALGPSRVVQFRFSCGVAQMSSPSDNSKSNRGGQISLASFFSPRVKEAAKEKSQEKSKQQSKPTGHRHLPLSKAAPQAPGEEQAAKEAHRTQAPAAVSTEAAAEPIASTPSGPADSGSAAQSTASAGLNNGLGALESCSIAQCVGSVDGGLAAGSTKAVAEPSTSASFGPADSDPASASTQAAAQAPSELMAGSQSGPADGIVAPLSAETASEPIASRLSGPADSAPAAGSTHVPAEAALDAIARAPAESVFLVTRTGLEEASNMWDGVFSLAQSTAVGDHAQDNAEASFGHFFLMEDDIEASADADPEIAASSSDVAEAACILLIILLLPLCF